MIDLVERLRAIVSERNCNGAEPLLTEAAKEIERLRTMCGLHWMACTEAQARIERLHHANRTRPDYDLRCQDCGRAHILDTSIPSDIWNAITKDGASLLCTTCIDDRMAANGIKSDEAEFYFVGGALRSKLYAESHGEVSFLQAECERLREALAPFAALAEIFDVRRGMTPTEGEIYQWCIGGKEYSLTVEHLREARRALAPSEDRT